MPNGFYSPFDDFFGELGEPFFRQVQPRRRQIDLTNYLSERANRTIAEAVSEAAKHKSGTLDTEHLLLAVAKDTDVGAKIIKQLGIEPNDLVSYLEGNIVEGESQRKTPSLSPRAKRVLELAFFEAQELGHSYIGSEHILLGLIREGEGLAAQTLKKYAVDLTRGRAAVIKLIGKGSPEGKVKEASKTPTVDQYSRDLTQLAKRGNLDPVIGRGPEIERVVHILSRRTKNNPVLIGEPGVGKTAIVEGLAQRIVSGDVSETLRGKRVLALDLALMVAGTRYRGEFEERLKKAVEEIVKAHRQVIVFVDELHTVVGAGAAEGALDAGNILKPALARGDLQAIGATTLGEYKKHIETDAALERRFQPIIIPENTVEETVLILRGLRDRYEAHHRVKITDEAIAAAANLSDRYIADRFLPDKAIDLIDEAAARVRLRSVEPPENLRQAQASLNKLRQEAEATQRAKNAPKMRQIGEEIKKLEKVEGELKELWDKAKGTEQPEVTFEDVAQVVSAMTGIPLSKLSEEEKEKLTKLEERLHQRLVNQNEAVRIVSEAIRRARAGLKDPNHPIGSFFFIGPTGVGKTELTKALAEALYGDENLMLRLDMSEYQERHTVSRLIGSPPGYVGFEEGGQLTEVVRRRPFSVILLDEIEKAHPDVFNLLLQIMDDGRLTDGKGRTVSFKNAILVMTSNLGADIFRRADFSQNDIKEQLSERLKSAFRPEFLNRLDEVVLFDKLGEEELKKIVDLRLEELRRLLKAQGLDLKVSGRAKTYLAKEGYDPEYGARPLKRLIQREVENPVSEMIIKGDFTEGDTVKVSYADGKLGFGKV